MISFFVPEIFKFLCYTNYKSCHLFVSMETNVKINNISRGNGYGYLKFGTNIVP